MLYNHACMTGRFTCRVPASVIMRSHHFERLLSMMQGKSDYKFEPGFKLFLRNALVKESYALATYVKDARCMVLKLTTQHKVCMETRASDSEFRKNS